MNRDKCTGCGSSDLYRSKLTANSGVMIARARNQLAWNWVTVQCNTCLSCGTVTPYVAEPGLAKLREWNDRDGQVSPGAEERAGLDPRAVAIAFAILGALASFGFYMMGVIDKLKTH